MKLPSTTSVKQGLIGKSLFRVALMASSMAAGAFVFGLVTWSMERGDPRRSLTSAIDSSVQVFTERDTGGRRAGSAVVVVPGSGGQPSLIITTAHTFEPIVDQSVFVVVPPGSERIEARLLALDHERDLALLAAHIDPIATASMADGAYLVDSMWVIGFPWGRERTVVNGAVSQIEKGPLDPPHNLIKGPVRLIDASVSYGMSGGGVFASKTGHLVGLVQGYRTAHLSLPSSNEPLKLPVAGETTVISSPKIACFLAAIEDWWIGEADKQLAIQSARLVEAGLACPDNETGVAAR